MKVSRGHAGQGRISEDETTFNFRSKIEDTGDDTMSDVRDEPKLQIIVASTREKSGGLAVAMWFEAFA